VTTAHAEAPAEAIDGPRGTGSTGSRTIGILALVGLASVLALGLFISPEDVDQGNAVRMMYVHVPVSTTAFLAFGITALGSALYLWKKSEFWDAVAAASAEIGVVLTGLSLATGMLWGRPTWGVWWVWDARLTSTALLFVAFLGYLAMRRLTSEPTVRAKRAAWVGLIAFVDVPIVHFSTVWWNTLHQGPTITKGDPTIGGLQLFTLMIGFVAFLLVYWWLMIHRFRLQWIENRIDDIGMQAALDERRAEGRADGRRRPDEGLGGAVPEGA
jgi:heme exporter protein C